MKRDRVRPLSFCWSFGNLSEQSNVSVWGYLGWKGTEEGKVTGFRYLHGHCARKGACVYRGTSLIRNAHPPRTPTGP